MCRLIESIRIENGLAPLLGWHQKRVNQSQSNLIGLTPCLHLNHAIRVPEHAQNGIYKCRLVYDSEIREISFKPYRFPAIRSLKLVYCDDIDYRFKFENRMDLEKLFNQRGNCDDIIIVKNGCITDSSFCNLIFSDGVSLFTPDRPLLKGVRRNFLLESGIIREAEIRPTDLKHFRYLHLINAMIGLGDMLPVRTELVFH